VCVCVCIYMYVLLTSAFRHLDQGAIAILLCLGGGAEVTVRYADYKTQQIVSNML
jgi:hypothetical protein